MPERTVFFVSDGTGITAETFGNSVLAQFEAKPRHVRRPFIDSVDKALAVVGEINEVAEHEGKRPIVFITLVNDDVRAIVAGGHAKALVLDMIRTFVEPLEQEFGVKSNHRIGRFPDVSASREYHDRIEAINFSLAHDDGQSARNLAQADVVLLGVSRSREVPLENAGGPGTRDSHWRETLFGNELMSGYVAAAGNPLSKLTLASLQDIGYQVDMKAAEPYSMPNLQHLAESGMLSARAFAMAQEAGQVLPYIPVVLAEDSIDV